jgi:hypothetical protein
MSPLEYYNYIIGTISPGEVITINVHDGKNDNMFVYEVSTSVSSLSKSNRLRQLFEDAAYVMNVYACRDVAGRPGWVFDLSFSEDV